MQIKPTSPLPEWSAVRQRTGLAIDVSVVICCYNSATRLPATLDALDAQIAPRVVWEVIVVDNCSTDGTDGVARQGWKRSEINLRIVHAAPAGLSFAREAGIAAARGRYLLFCDDDNGLSPSYLETAVSQLDLDPSAAALGGLGVPLCEIEAPFWLPRQERIYATGPQAAGDEAVVELLYGAGLVVRQSALAQVQQSNFPFVLTGRMCGKLTAGDDTELCYLLRLFGYKIKFHSGLVFHHRIPNHRLNITYLENLYAGFGRAQPFLGAYRAALRSQEPGRFFPHFYSNVLACAGRDIVVGIWASVMILIQKRRADTSFWHMQRAAMIAQLTLPWSRAERLRYFSLLRRLSQRPPLCTARSATTVLDGPEASLSQ